MTFDPYYKWLGIPPDEQPPNYYRLLGLNAFEQNLDAIDNAADRQMGHLRMFQAGPQGGLSQQLLNEIALARLCLMNPASKLAYDDALRAGLSPPTPAIAPVAPLPPAVVEVQYGLSPEGVRPVGVQRREASAAARRPQKDTTVEIVKIVAGGIAGIVLATLLLRFVFSMDVTGLLPVNQQEERSKIAALPETPVTASVKASVPRSEIKPDYPPVSSNPSQEEPPPTGPPSPASENSTDSAALSFPTPPPSLPEAAGKTKEAPSSAPANTATLLPGRLPLPSDAERQAAEKALDEVLDPATLAEDAAKLARARELLQVGRDRRTKPAERWAILRRVATLAAEGADARLVAESIDVLAQTFEMDTLSAEATLLGQVARRAKTAAEIEGLVATSREAIHFALGEEQFDIAKNLADAVRSACDRPAGQPYRKFVNDGQKEIARQQQAWQERQTALATLKTSAADPAANLAVARWWILERGDWDSALSYLAAGGDGPLKAAVQLDRSKSTDGKGQDRMAIANAWYAAGKAAGANPLWLVRAKAWYLATNKAEVSGLDGANLERRVAELALDEQLHPLEELIGRGRGAARIHSSLAPVVRRHCVLLMPFEQADHFHDGKNWMLTDRSGQQNHGAAHGAAAAPGRAGMALEFDGRDDYVECPDQPNLNPVGAMSICAWVRPRSWLNTRNAWDYLVSKDDWQQGARGYVLRIAGEGHLNFTLGLGSDWSHGRNVGAGQTRLSIGESVHVAAVYDGQQIVTLVNGVEQMSQPCTRPIAASPVALRIGRGSFDEKRRFHGLIDEVAVFQMALATADIQAIIDMGREGKSLAE